MGRVVLGWVGVVGQMVRLMAKPRRLGSWEYVGVCVCVCVCMVVCMCVCEFVCVICNFYTL